MAEGEISVTSTMLLSDESLRCCDDDQLAIPTAFLVSIPLKFLERGVGGDTAEKERAL